MTMESLRELDLLPFGVEDGSEFDTGEVAGEVATDEGASKAAEVPVSPFTVEFQY
jgi:hypothetical protein